MCWTMIEVIDDIKLPKGFKAAGLHSGLKKAKKDMAMVYSDAICTSGSAYTTNRVKAAPVQYDISIKDTAKHGVVINSGNANACTGKEGMENAEKMASYAASLLGGDASEYFVCSTGVIGVQLPMETVLSGIKGLASALSDSYQSSLDAADAILTTDTARKTVTASFEIDGKCVTVTGFAKGSGMIHPNMATTLSFILTDAAVSHNILQTLLGSTVEDTFNMISIDGDTSTNDTCIVLANGASGVNIDSDDKEGLFRSALSSVLGELARKLTKDGEGAGRFIEVSVEGAKDKKNAKILARSVVSSNLVKAAFFGSDANWGRILCAMGYSGADFNPEDVDLYFRSAKGTIATLKKGTPVVFDEAKAKEILLEKEVEVLVKLGEGEGEAKAWGCDLTYEYVRINGDYRS